MHYEYFYLFPNGRNFSAVTRRQSRCRSFALANATRPRHSAQVEMECDKFFLPRPNSIISDKASWRQNEEMRQTIYAAGGL